MEKMNWTPMLDLLLSLAYMRQSSDVLIIHPRRRPRVAPRLARCAAAAPTYQPVVWLGATRVVLGKVMAVWIAMPWSSVKDGDATVVQVAGPGRTTWRGWPIGGADSLLGRGPRHECSVDVVRGLHPVAASLRGHGHRETVPHAKHVQGAGALTVTGRKY